MIRFQMVRMRNVICDHCKKQWLGSFGQIGWAGRRKKFHYCTDNTICEKAVEIQADGWWKKNK